MNVTKHRPLLVFITSPDNTARYSNVLKALYTLKHTIPIWKVKGLQILSKLYAASDIW